MMFPYKCGFISRTTKPLECVADENGLKPTGYHSFENWWICIPFNKISAKHSLINIPVV